MAENTHGMALCTIWSHLYIGYPLRYQFTHLIELRLFPALSGRHDWDLRTFDSQPSNLG